MKAYEHLIYSDEPAKLFNEAYPIGNGKLGGMIYGDPTNLKLSLNHDELWQGYQPLGKAALYDKSAYPEAQKLALEGKYYEAQKLIQSKLSIDNAAAYITLGNLFIDLDAKNVTNYRRELDIRNSVAKVSFLENEAPVSVEYIASYPDNVIAIKISSENPLDFSVSPEFSLSEAKICSPNRIISFGQCANLSERQRNKSEFVPFADGKTGVSFLAGMELESDGETSVKCDKINVSGARETVMYISAETSFFEGCEHGKDNYKELLYSYLDKAADSAARTLQ